MIKFVHSFHKQLSCEGWFGMDENELKKRVLNGKKTERLVFAVSSEMKQAIEAIAHEKCVSVSALLISLATSEVLANKELFEEADA